MKTKVFQSGNSLAIRIPKSFNVTKDCEFDIKQDDKCIILTPIACWQNLFNGIDSFKGEIKRDDLSVQVREWQK